MARQGLKESSLFRRFLPVIFVLALVAGVASGETAVQVTDVAQADTADAARLAETDDVIATVGDQAIHFSQLAQELDQGAVPGVSVPGYGTPERKRLLMRVLDNAIRNELLYLDAQRRGLDRDPAYQRELARFEEAVLAGLFRERRGALGAPWRDGIAITLNEEVLDPARDAERSDGEVLASVGNTAITWGDAKARLLAATRRAALSEGASDVAAERRKVLDQLIDVPIMALRAREADLHQDPAYLQRVAELKQTSLAGFRYRQLAAAFAPTEDDIAAYALEHAQTLGDPDERARRAIERALVEQKVAAYANGLQEAEFRVMVDEARLDRLLAQEAEQQAAPAASAGKQ